MPSWYHTGTPLHFHSSTTSGSASLIKVRSRPSTLPLQSPSSLILASISREGESPPFPSLEPLFLFFMVVVVFFMVVVAHPSFELYLGYAPGDFPLTFVWPAMVLTPVRRGVTRCATWWHTAAQTSRGP